MFIFLMVKATFSTCPKILCESYSSHLCGIFSDDSIELSPCLNGDFCNIQNLYKNWEEGKTGLECSEALEAGPIDSVYELMHDVCKSPPNIGKKLSGIHPKMCNSNNDCVLNDGSQAECKCGLSVSGYKYCEISEGDDLAVEMFNSACKSDLNQFLYFLMKVEFFVYLHDRPSCAGFVFEDLAAIDYLYSGGMLSEKKSENDSFGMSMNAVFLYMITYY